MWWYIFVTLPHIIYAVSYHYGNILIKYVPFTVFRDSSICYRGIFYPVTFYYGYKNIFNGFDVVDWFSPTPILIGGSVLITYGSVINYYAYKKLTVDGVYYACEMINKCKRAEGFPYNCIKHPIYSGAISSVIGTGMIFGFDKNYQIRTEICIPIGYLVMLYLMSIYIEALPSLVFKHKLA